MISMPPSTVYPSFAAERESVASIARKTRNQRADSLRKYLAKEDLSAVPSVESRARR